MIDALLWAVHDAIIAAPFGYDKRVVSIRPNGQPPPDCGDIYIAVHEGRSTSDMDNALNEYFSFSVTLTMRLTNVPFDRIGKDLEAKMVQKASGFNRRAEQLRAFLHMNWGLLGPANTYLVQMNPDAEFVYGFCEPPRYRGMETPTLVHGDCAKWVR